MEVMYRDLEEKNSPAFAPGMGLVLNSTGLSLVGTPPVTSQQQQTQQQPPSQQQVGQQRFQAA